MLEVVKQVSTLLWPYLFGRQPDSVERDDTVRTASPLHAYLRRGRYSAARIVSA